jgi:hypothetical protein
MRALLGAALVLLAAAARADDAKVKVGDWACVKADDGTRWEGHLPRK